MDKSIAKAAPHLTYTVRRRDGGRQAMPSTQDILSSARDSLVSPRGSLSDFKASRVIAASLNKQELYKKQLLATPAVQKPGERLPLISNR